MTPIHLMCIWKHRQLSNYKYFCKIPLVENDSFSEQQSQSHTHREKSDV